MVDVARLRKGLEYIAAHPKEHNQATWAADTLCGSTKCLGGTVLNQAGYGFIVKHDAHSCGMYIASIDRYITQDVLTHVMYVLDPDTNDEVFAGDAARELLGLTEEQAEALLYQTVTIDDLYRVANEITNGEIEIP